MRKCGFILLSLTVIGVAIAGCVWRGPSEHPTDEARRNVRLVSGSDVQKPLAGSTSCAGRACHGRLERSNNPDDKYTLDEFTTWVTTDPHVNAYQVLEQQRSKDIAERLGIVNAKGEPNPHESARCLACHTTSEAARTPDNPDLAALVKQERSLGVGCESCHGNATGWLDKHITKDWQKWKDQPEEKEKYGWVNVAEGAKLAQRCVGCHVGSPGTDAFPPRDVNHDLIAAGHPRLNFEFSSFWSNLPVHWKRKDFPHVQRWAVGQLVSAEAALELLKYRAEATDKDDDTRVWPEFAEYDCYGCHHNLTYPSWRQKEGRDRNERPRGELAWGSWYYPVVESMGLSPLDTLQKAMEKRNPSRAEVAKALADGHQALSKLHTEWAKSKGTPAELARSQIDRLLDHKRLERESSWDAAEQTFLSLYALNQVAQDAELQARLARVLPMRAFQPGHNSPRSDPKLGFLPDEVFKTLRGK